MSELRINLFPIKSWIVGIKYKDDTTFTLNVVCGIDYIMGDTTKRLLELGKYRDWAEVKEIRILEDTVDV